MENGKSLKEKVLFLMCLGVLAGNMSTEVYAEPEPESDFEYEYNAVGAVGAVNNPLILKKIEKKSGIKILNEKFENFVVDFNDKRDIEKDENGLYLESNRSSNNTSTVNLNENTKIISRQGYALYVNTIARSSLTATASIIINKDKKNTVQIMGDIYSKSEASGTEGKDVANSNIILNLSDYKSFFAGEIKTEKKEENNGKATAGVELNLEKEATWYVHNSNGKDEYDISSKDESLKTLITSDGGVIDIYHHSPNKTYTEYYVEQLEIMVKQGLEELDKTSPTYKSDREALIADAKAIYEYLQVNKKIGERTLTLNGVGDRLQNTTFRISTDVENKKADKIVLNGVEVKKDSETYFIEIAADPFKSGEWKADKDDKILVMDINGKDLDKITVKGKECEAEIGAGLVKQTITPTVEEDSNNKGDWYLTAIEKVENTAGNKGSGHIFAEIGAAANAGMASAWRTDSGDLYQRMGNLRNNEAEQGVWGRIYTGENEVRKGIGLDLEYRAVQVGYDRKQNIDGGKLFTGIAFGYFDGNADYDHGSGESNSATVGMYAAYSGNNGSFGDFIVKLGNIDNKLSYTSENGDYYKADYDTYGFSADAEYGYRYELNNDYYIEPLAQLSYIYIADEEYTMNLNGESGAKVSNDDYQSLIGYAGFHYGKKFGDNVAYLRVAAAHEFAGDIDVDARYQDIKVNSSISGEDTWVEYGVGFDVKVKEDTAVYGRLQKSTGDVVKNKWHASVGIRYTF